MTPGEILARRLQGDQSMTNEKFVTASEEFFGSRGVKVTITHANLESEPTEEDCWDGDDSHTE